MDNLMKTCRLVIVIVLVCQTQSFAWYGNSMTNVTTSSSTAPTTQPTTRVSTTTTTTPMTTRASTTPTSPITTKAPNRSTSSTPTPVDNVPPATAKTTFPSALLMKILQNLGHNADAMNQMAVNMKEESDIANDVAALI